MERIRIFEQPAEVIEFRHIRNSSNNVIIYEKELNLEILKHSRTDNLIARLSSLKTIIDIYLINRVMGEDRGLSLLLEDCGYQYGFGYKTYKSLSTKLGDEFGLKEIADYYINLYKETDSNRELEMFAKVMNEFAKYNANGWKKDLGNIAEYDNINLTNEYLSEEQPPIIDIKSYIR